MNLPIVWAYALGFRTRLASWFPNLCAAGGLLAVGFLETARRDRIRAARTLCGVISQRRTGHPH